MTPTFSIILPTYNRAWVLPKTLQFILAQDFSDWELIVVDDGSTDGTKTSVDRFSSQDKRIRYMYQPNARKAAARQRGLEEARARWVTYIDSDEEVYPFYLSKPLEFFSQHPEVWFAYANMDRTLELHDPQHQVLASVQQPATALDPKTVTLKSYGHWLIYPCGTGIFHLRGKIQPGIAWDIHFPRFEDLDFVFQLGAAYPDHFGFVPTRLFHQRQVFGTDGICGNTSYAEWADGFEQLYLKWKDAWFMQGQEWYPKKVEDYRERQRLFDQGKYPSPVERNFPNYFQHE